jgi:hypothetical protein
MFNVEDQTETTETQKDEDMAKKKAKKKKVAAKKAAPKTKTKTKKVVKREGSAAQYIKDAIEKGGRNVDKILAATKAKFPKSKPTRGYVRWLAKGLKVKMDETERATKAKAKKQKAVDSPAVDPAS